jgi:hypothetical protein
MCVVAANATRKGAGPPGERRPGVSRRWAFVEDLNWPAPAPPGKKPDRPVEVWAPGPIGTWEGIVPRIQ